MFAAKILIHVKIKSKFCKKKKGGEKKEIESLINGIKQTILYFAQLKLTKRPKDERSNSHNSSYISGNRNGFPFLVPMNLTKKSLHLRDKQRNKKHTH